MHLHYTLTYYTTAAARTLQYGITHMGLAKLLHGGTDPSYSSLEYFVRHYVEVSSPL